MLDWDGGERVYVRAVHAGGGTETTLGEGRATCVCAMVEGVWGGAGRRGPDGTGSVPLRGGGRIPRMSPRFALPVGESEPGRFRYGAEGGADE